LNKVVQGQALKWAAWIKIEHTVVLLSGVGVAA
jgi:hypothetical protein